MRSMMGALEHLKQGNTYRDEKKWSEVIDEYSRAIELDPNCAMAYFNRAWAYDEKGQYDLAIAYNSSLDLSEDLVFSRARFAGIALWKIPNSCEKAILLKNIHTRARKILQAKNWEKVDL